MNVTVVAAWQLHYAVNQRPLSDLEFRREIAVAYMKTPLGFTLRRHLYGGPTADLPANNCFDGIDYPRFQPQKGDAKSARKMLDTCGKCGVRCGYGKCGVRLHCNKSALCFDMYHTNK